MDALAVEERAAIGMLDWTVNGVRLRDLLGPRSPPAETTGMVSGWDLDAAIRGLDGLAEADAGEFDDGRAAILVCAECGDLECGALSLRVRIDGELVSWSEFGWQVPRVEGFEPISVPLSFTFAAPGYRSRIASLKRRLVSTSTTVPGAGRLWWRTPETTVVHI